MRESELLKHIYANSGSLPEHVAIGPGDDMGAFHVGDRSFLVTVDQVAEGVHVDLSRASLEQVAAKSITRNLSDVAAMAAQPLGAVVAAALPRSWDQQRGDELFDALHREGQRHECPLIGGDISIWDHPMLLSITVLAESAGVSPVLRSGAKAGDLIYVTGRLGGAWNPQDPREAPTLEVQPRVKVARELASQTRIHSMIDLSDGLARDLGHICEMSRVRAEIDVQRIPVREQAQRLAQTSGKPAWEHALADGEDYELCLTMDSIAEEWMPGSVKGVPIKCIGKVLRTRPQAEDEDLIYLKLPDGTTQPLGELGPMGWEHTS